MTENKDPEAISPGGSPIYRHEEAGPWQAPQGEQCAEQISGHIEKHLGKVESVFHEIVSDTVHIDVNFVKPTPEFPFIRLITSGMSDLPMSTPEGIDAPKFAELLVTLPKDWRLDEESFKNEEWYWPIRLLKDLARLPHKYQTWLGWGHTVPNGDPPDPYAGNTKLCGSIVLPSVTVPAAFDTLVINDQKTIAFYAVLPLYEEEMNLKLRFGTDALLEKLGKRKITDIIEPARRNAAKRWLGIF